MPYMTGSSSNRVLHDLMASDDDSRPLREGERRLGRFILPPFQREAVWTLKQKVALIESIWMELPIGTYVYNQTYYHGKTDMWLIDGQQRVTAIFEYINDGFPIKGSDGIEYYYSEITAVDKRFWGQKCFPAIVLNVEDEAKLENIYERLVYGGTAHDPKED